MWTQTVIMAKVTMSVHGKEQDLFSLDGKGCVSFSYTHYQYKHIYGFGGETGKIQPYEHDIPLLKPINSGCQFFKDIVKR